MIIIFCQMAICYKKLKTTGSSSYMITPLESRNNNERADTLTLTEEGKKKLIVSLQPYSYMFRHSGVHGARVEMSLTAGLLFRAACQTSSFFFSWMEHGLTEYTEAFFFFLPCLFLGLSLTSRGNVVL